VSGNFNLSRSAPAPLPLRSHALYHGLESIRNTDTESVLKFSIVQKFQNIRRSVSESFQDFRMHIKFQNHSNVSESLRLSESVYCFRISHSESFISFRICEGQNRSKIQNAYQISESLMPR